MFEAKVNDHHIAASSRCRISLLSRDLLYLILWQYQCFELVKGMFVGGIHNTGFHGADFPDLFGQRPGVNAAHAGVKNNFTSRDRFRTKADARKNTAVFQN